MMFVHSIGAGAGVGDVTAAASPPWAGGAGSAMGSPPFVDSEGPTRTAAPDVSKTVELRGINEGNIPEISVDTRPRLEFLLYSPIRCPRCARSGDVNGLAAPGCTISEDSGDSLHLEWRDEDITTGGDGSSAVCVVSVAESKRMLCVLSRWRSVHAALKALAEMSVLDFENDETSIRCETAEWDTWCKIRVCIAISRASVAAPGWKATSMLWLLAVRLRDVRIASVVDELLHRDIVNRLPSDLGVEWGETNDCLRHLRSGTLHLSDPQKVAFVLAETETMAPQVEERAQRTNGEGGYLLPIDVGELNAASQLLLTSQRDLVDSPQGRDRALLQPAWPVLGDSDTDLPSIPKHVHRLLWLLCRERFGKAPLMRVFLGIIGARRFHYLGRRSELSQAPLFTRERVSLLRIVRDWKRAFTSSIDHLPSGSAEGDAPWRAVEDTLQYQRMFASPCGPLYTVRRGSKWQWASKLLHRCIESVVYPVPTVESGTVRGPLPVYLHSLVSGLHSIVLTLTWAVGELMRKGLRGPAKQIVLLLLNLQHEVGPITEREPIVVVPDAADRAVSLRTSQFGIGYLFKTLDSLCPDPRAQLKTRSTAATRSVGIAIKAPRTGDDDFPASKRPRPSGTHSDQLRSAAACFNDAISAGDGGTSFCVRSTEHFRAQWYFHLLTILRRDGDVDDELAACDEGIAKLGRHPLFGGSYVMRHLRKRRELAARAAVDTDRTPVKKFPREHRGSWTPPRVEIWGDKVVKPVTAMRGKQEFWGLDDTRLHVEELALVFFTLPGCGPTKVFHSERKHAGSDSDVHVLTPGRLAALRDGDDKRAASIQARCLAAAERRHRDRIAASSAVHEELRVADDPEPTSPGREMRLPVVGDIDGWRGVHSENQLWTTLFGLFFWDSVFANAEIAPAIDSESSGGGGHSASGCYGVWRHEFQGQPLDFGGPEFYAARKAMIDERLAWLRESQGRDRADALRSRWQASVGCFCPFVNWCIFRIEDLCKICVAAPGRVLAGIFSALARDFRNWRAGLPDLCLWRDPKVKGSRVNFYLVEVKGPGDSLSHAQEQWLRELHRVGAGCGVCEVVETR